MGTILIRWIGNQLLLRWQQQTNNNPPIQPDKTTNGPLKKNFKYEETKDDASNIEAMNTLYASAKED